jgi:cysteinyl-tRNA synthetase
MRLYDTLTRGLVDLPEPPARIGMYFCGPTVYQRAHVGNARPFVLGMWLRAWLRHRGYDATLVHNITDINDRIYEAAPGASAELAAKATEWYLEDTRDLGLGEPDAWPKATQTVPQIVAFIEQLIARDFAYAVEGDVYFRVARYPDYGQLSRQRPDQVEEQEPNPRKEDPRDFALWKANKPGEDTWWDSPWGRGRPGWHIECSVMAEELLGSEFEIHGGGLDLVFPHHENELAQSRALGHSFAHVWTHNGLLRFTGSKMSKSEGNVVTIRDALDRWGRETLLLFFMTGHWSKPLDFSVELMESTRNRAGGIRNSFMSHPWRLSVDLLERFTREPNATATPEEIRSPQVGDYLQQLLIAGSGLRWHPRYSGANLPPFRVGGWTSDVVSRAVRAWSIALPPLDVAAEEGARMDWDRFTLALDNDFGTPEALAQMRRWQRGKKLGLLYAGLSVFGLNTLAYRSDVPPPRLVALAARRLTARTNSDYAEADRISEQLAAEGWEVRDLEAPPGFELVRK